MNRKRLEERLAALESQVTPVPALSPSEMKEIAAEHRAAGESEDDVYRALEAKDPGLMRRGLVGPRQYLSCDHGWVTPEQWASASKDPFVAIVGRLEKLGLFSVLTPADERETITVPEGFSWRSLDPLAVFYLGLLVHHAPAWKVYWSRPRDFRDRVGLFQFYLGTAQRRAKRFVAENKKKTVADYRQKLDQKIAWILSQAADPELPPWFRSNDEEDVA